MPELRRQKPSNQKHSDEQIKKALRHSHGIISAAAAWLTQSTGRPITREGVSKRVNSNPELQAYRMQLEEVTKDVAENHVITGILSGDPRYVNFYLSTKGKDRGYSRRDEVTGPDGGPIQFVDLSELSSDDLATLHRVLSTAKPPQP